MELYPHQKDAIARARQAWPRKPIICVPTGGGKSVIGSEIVNTARAKGSRVLWLVHRRELVHQAADHIGDCGLIMAGEKPSENTVQVAAVQTLARRELPPADLVIVDECHHCRSKTFERILGEYRHIIGLSATPVRLDGRGLGNLFDTIIEPVTVEFLIENGYLAKFDYYAPSEPDLRDVKKTGGDFVKSGASEAMSKPAIVGSIKEHYAELAHGKPTLLFAPSVEYSKRMAAELGGEHVDAKTPRKERDAIFARLRDGTTPLVCNVEIVTEGVDVPHLGCVILARPTASISLARQMVGRALRPGHGDALVLDHAGICWRHGLPDEPVEWSLEDRPKTARECRLTRCEKCYAVMPAGLSVCPRCGEAKELKQRRGPLEVEGRLKKVKKAKRRMPSMPPQMRNEYRRLAWEAMSKGYKSGWARMRFKQQHGRYAYGTRVDDDEIKAACTHVRRDGGVCRYCGSTAGAQLELGVE